MKVFDYILCLVSYIGYGLTQCEMFQGMSVLDRLLCEEDALEATMSDIRAQHDHIIAQGEVMSHIIAVAHALELQSAQGESFDYSLSPWS